MQGTLTNPGPVIELNRKALDARRRENGIGTEAELASRIGVNETTLWRVSNKSVTPSSGFIAAVLVAFPKASFGELFKVVAG